MEKKYGIGFCLEKSFKYPLIKIFCGSKFYVFAWVKNVGFNKFMYYTESDTQREIVKNNKLDKVNFGLFAITENE